MKNWLFVSLALFSTFIFLSCSQKKTKPTSNSLTLALRSGLYSDVVKSCLLDFERENNVLCIVQDYSEDDLHKKILENDGTIDLCMADSSWAQELAANGSLFDLKKEGYALDRDIIDATKKACYSGEKLLLAPYYGNVTVLLFNKFIIKEAGFKPEDINSIDDILEICRSSNKRHNLGFMYRGDTANNIFMDFLPILLSYGGWVVDSENNPTVSTSEFLEAVEAYKALIKTGRAAKKDDLVAAIANKAAAMGIGWPGWYTPTRNSSMDYLAITGRSSKGSKPRNANIYGVWMLGVPSASKKHTLSVKLLDYLMSPSVQRETVIKGGVPCRYSSLCAPEVQKKFPQYTMILSALEGGVYRPAMQEWSKFYTILGAHLKAIFSEDADAETELKSAQSELESMLKTEKNE